MPTVSERIYVDLEYTYPDMNRETRPTDKDMREIVQIAAIRINTAGVELAHLDVLVRPKFQPKLPEFFVELTGITQESVDRVGVPFDEALMHFVRFCSDIPIWTFIGDYDVFQQNCALHAIEFPFITRPFVCVKPMLAAWGIDSSVYSSGTLYRAAGLRMEGHVHNALHDVRSMAAAVCHFESAAFRS